MSEIKNVSVWVASGPLQEVEYICDADYQPAEPTTLHPIDLAEPGCDEGVDLTQIIMVIPESRQQIDVTETVKQSDRWTREIADLVLDDYSEKAASAREVYDESRRNWA